MKKVLTMLLAALGLLQIAPAAFADEEFGSSAWLAYWDVDSALREVRELPDSFESLICFEAYFDLDGNWILPPESKQLLEEMKALDVPVYLSLVNDVQQEDGSFKQKSKDFLVQQL